MNFIGVKKTKCGGGRGGGCEKKIEGGMQERGKGDKIWGSAKQIEGGGQIG